jgi:hypothetical protein
MTTVTTTNVNLEHPYRTGGILAVLLSFGVLAFSLGVLNRCGGGHGVCFDTATHASGDAGLVVFILVLIIGVAMIVYTGDTASFQTRPKAPEAPKAAPAVTNVFPAAAAPAPAPAPTVIVNP